MYPSISILLDPIQTLQHLDVREGMHVGELGCGGHGHFVFALASLVGPNGLVYAVDIQKTPLAAIASRARHGNVHQVKTVLTDLEMTKVHGLASGSLDRAAMINVIFQAKNLERMLRRAFQLLKPNSLLVVVDWRPERTPFGPRPVHRVGPAGLEAVASTVGFQVREKFVPGPHHYGYLFHRP